MGVILEKFGKKYKVNGEEVLGWMSPHEASDEEIARITYMLFLQKGMPAQLGIEPDTVVTVDENRYYCQGVAENREGETLCALEPISNEGDIATVSLPSKINIWGRLNKEGE